MPEIFRQFVKSLIHSGTLQNPWKNQWFCKIPEILLWKFDRLSETKMTNIIEVYYPHQPSFRRINIWRWYFSEFSFRSQLQFLFSHDILEWHRLFHLTFSLRHLRIYVSCSVLPLNSCISEILAHHIWTHNYWTALWRWWVCVWRVVFLRPAVGPTIIRVWVSLGRCAARGQILYGPPDLTAAPVNFKAMAEIDGKLLALLHVLGTGFCVHTVQG